MKRIIYMTICLLFSLVAVAQDMKSLFVAMPDSVLPLLTKVNREDCIDFLDSNMKAVVKNRFGSQAEMKALTGDYLQMQVTEVSTVEMKLLPLNDSVKVIGMVKTLCASACDSEVRFFNTAWQELPASDFLQYPSADAFFLPVDTTDISFPEIRAKADMNLLKASFSPDEALLAFVYDTPEYLNKEDREKLSPYLKKEPVVLRWEEGMFR